MRWGRQGVKIKRLRSACVRTNSWRQSVLWLRELSPPFNSGRPERPESFKLLYRRTRSDLRWEFEELAAFQAGLIDRLRVLTEAIGEGFLCTKELASTPTTVGEMVSGALFRSGMRLQLLGVDDDKERGRIHTQCKRKTQGLFKDKRSVFCGIIHMEINIFYLERAS